MAAMTFAISVNMAPSTQAQQMQPCRPVQCNQHTSASGEMAFPCQLKNIWDLGEEESTGLDAYARHSAEFLPIFSPRFLVNSVTSCYKSPGQRKGN